MNPRISKELRVIVPYAVVSQAACFGAAAGAKALHLSWEDVWGFAVLAEFVFFLLAGSVLFGAEFSDSTMERLLSQPVPRERIWKEKIFSLVAVLIPCMFFNLGDSVSRYLRLGPYRWGNFMTIMDALGSFFLALTAASIAISTAPMLALYTRKTHTAFFGSLVLPLAGLLLVLMLSQIIASMLPRAPGQASINESRLSLIVFFVFASVWCSSTYWLARRRFLKLEIS